MFPDSEFKNCKFVRNFERHKGKEVPSELSLFLCIACAQLRQRGDFDYKRMNKVFTLGRQLARQTMGSEPLPVFHTLGSARCGRKIFGILALISKIDFSIYALKKSKGQKGGVMDILIPILTVNSDFDDSEILLYDGKGRFSLVTDRDRFARYEAVDISHHCKFCQAQLSSRRNRWRHEQKCRFLRFAGRYPLHIVAKFTQRIVHPKRIEEQKFVACKYFVELISQYG